MDARTAAAEGERGTARTTMVVVAATEAAPVEIMAAINGEYKYKIQ